METHSPRRDRDDVENDASTPLESSRNFVGSFVDFSSKGQEGAFDSHGCLNPVRWKEIETIIPDDNIVVADNPSEEVRAALSQLSIISNQITPSEITFGIGDEDTLPRLIRDGARINVTIRTPEGRSPLEWSPIRLLRSLITYAEMKQADDLASLLRHPDLDHWLKATTGKTNVTMSFLKSIDHWRTTRLPATLNVHSLGEEDRQSAVDRLGLIVDLLSNGKKSVEEWMSRFAGILEMIYPEERKEDHTEETRRVLPLIHQAFVEGRSLSSTLLPECSAEETFSIVILLLNDHQLRIKLPNNAVRALSWKELLLNRSKYLIVVGMNEGKLPVEEEGSIFLTSVLRRSLGIPGPSEWEACNRYLIASIMNSRPNTRFIAGRASADGEPLLLSRLLLDGSAEEKARRLLRFSISQLLALR